MPHTFALPPVMLAAPVVEKQDLPGGGFIAGLITAVALVLQFMSLGQARAEQFLRAGGGRRFVRWIGAGLGIAGLTGVGAFVLGRPFLTSAFGHPHVPLLGELPLATARASASIVSRSIPKAGTTEAAGSASTA